MYDGEERVIGTWFGKPLYQKTISCGTLPSNGTKNIPYQINNLADVVYIGGWSTNGVVYLAIPHTSVTGAEKGIMLMLLKETGNISIITGTSLYTYEDTYITLRYTKTTD